jgi:hypothetical protein
MLPRVGDAPDGLYAQILTITSAAVRSPSRSPGRAANPAGSPRAAAGLQTSTTHALSEEIDRGDVVRYPSQNQ